jgi:hypothetical protein
VAAVTAGLTSAAGAQEPTGFLNRTVTVDGVSHRYQVYVPAVYSRARRWPVILFLHGSGERVPTGSSRPPSASVKGSVGTPGAGPRSFPQAPPEHRWHGAVAAPSRRWAAPSRNSAATPTGSISLGSPRADDAHGGAPRGASATRQRPALSGDRRADSIAPHLDLARRRGRRRPGRAIPPHGRGAPGSRRAGHVYRASRSGPRRVESGVRPGGASRWLLGQKRRAR